MCFYIFCSNVLAAVNESQVEIALYGEGLASSTDIRKEEKEI